MTKLVENAKIKKYKCGILSNFQTMWKLCNANKLHFFVKTVSKLWRLVLDLISFDAWDTVISAMEICTWTSPARPTVTKSWIKLNLFSMSGPASKMAASVPSTVYIYTVCQRSIFGSKNYNFLKSLKNNQFLCLRQNWLSLALKIRIIWIFAPKLVQNCNFIGLFR